MVVEVIVIITPAKGKEERVEEVIRQQIEIIKRDEPDLLSDRCYKRAGLDEGTEFVMIQRYVMLTCSIFRSLPSLPHELFLWLTYVQVQGRRGVQGPFSYRALQKAPWNHQWREPVGKFYVLHEAGTMSIWIWRSMTGVPRGHVRIYTPNAAQNLALQLRPVRNTYLASSKSSNFPGFVSFSLNTRSSFSWHLKFCITRSKSNKYPFGINDTEMVRPQVLELWPFP